MSAICKNLLGLLLLSNLSQLAVARPVVGVGLLSTRNLYHERSTEDLRPVIASLSAFNNDATNIMRDLDSGSPDVDKRSTSPEPCETVEGMGKSDKEIDRRDPKFDVKGKRSPQADSTPVINEALPPTPPESPRPQQNKSFSSINVVEPDDDLLEDVCAGASNSIACAAIAQQNVRRKRSPQDQLPGGPNPFSDISAGLRSKPNYEPEIHVGFPNSAAALVAAAAQGPSLTSTDAGVVNPAGPNVPVDGGAASGPAPVGAAANLHGYSTA